MNRFISTLTLLFLFSTRLLAIEVKGKTIDLATKQPVEFATTVLLKSDSTYMGGSQTDATGIFSISGQFEKQNYLLKISYLGYKTTYVKISNLSRSVDMGVIELEEDSKLLNEVTVTGNRIIN